MTLRTFKDIAAFKTDSGRILGFHSRNLEVAELSPDLWAAFESPQRFPDAYQELEQWSLSQNSEATDQIKSFGVSYLTLNVTQLCNLHCTYCAAGGDGTYGDPVAKINIEKTLPQIKFFLDKVPTGESFTIFFVGGEPLLYPETIKALSDYAKLYVAGKNIDLKFSLTTNATVINDKVVETLKSVRPLVMVSIDGPPDLHDRSRKTKQGTGSSQQVLAGLNKLKEIKQYLRGLVLNAVFDRNNTEAVRSYQYLSEFNADSIDLSFSHTETDLTASRNYMREMSEVARLAWEKGGEKELRKIKTFNSFFNLLDSQTRLLNHCGAGKSLAVVDARNKIYPCSWMVGEKEELLGQDLQINPAQAQVFSKPILELTGCSSCWARHLCGGGCMYTHKTATGNKFTVDKVFCERSQHLILSALTYYETARIL